MRPLGVPQTYPGAHALLSLTLVRVRLTPEQHATQAVWRSGPNWGGWIRTSDFLINSQRPRTLFDAQRAHFPSVASACHGQLSTRTPPESPYPAYPRRTLTRTKNTRKQTASTPPASTVTGYVRVRHSEPIRARQFSHALISEKGAAAW